MSKRIAVVFLCLVIATTLGACSKPFGGTPYESLNSWETDFIELPDGTESDEIVSNESSTTDTGSSTTTTSSGHSTTVNTPTSNAIKWPVESDGTTTASTAEKSTGGASSEDTTTVKPTTTTKPTTTNTTVAEVKGVQLPAVGYTQDGKLVVSKVSLQDKTVSVEFTNITKKFQTEDISKVEYVCYDKDGKELSTGALSIGILNPEKSVTCTFELAKDTDRVELKNWKVPFWTLEWY